MKYGLGGGTPDMFSVIHQAHGICLSFYLLGTQ